MKFKSLFFAVLAIFFGLMFSCNVPEKPETDPEDYLAPEILLKSPATVPFGSCPPYGAFDTIIVEADLYDNQGLKEYVITLSYAPDNYFLKTDADPMEVTRVGGIVGKNKTITKRIPIDYDASSGPYELTLEVWDNSDLSSSVSTCVQIQNGPDKNYPTFSMISPSTAILETFKIGEYLSIEGTVTDDVGITDAYFRIRNTYTKEILMGSEITYPSIGFPTFTFDTSVYIPPTVPGDYEVELYVRDSSQNLGLLAIPINIETN